MPVMWNTPIPEFYEGLCESCGLHVDACTCPECPVCGVYGDPDCVEAHGLVIDERRFDPEYSDDDARYLGLGLPTGGVQPTDDYRWDDGTEGNETAWNISVWGHE